MTAKLWARAIACGVLLGGAVKAAESATAYEQLIAPIFRARCVECHGEQKQKAKLALHTWESALRGSDGGPIWVAGKPGESVLLERLRLPLEEEEHMPPKDRAQPAPEEIALIARWIERGASPKAQVPDLQLSPELMAAAAELPARLAALAEASDGGEVGWEFDPAAVEKTRAPLAAKVAELQKRFPGALCYESRTSAMLTFTAAGLGHAFGDDEFAALAALGDAVVSLDLSGTAVTDRSAPLWSRFPNLRLVRAGFTAVGDASAAAIAQLTKLESLSLNNSAVSSASVEALSKLPALRRLHLAGTPAASAAREAKLPVIASEGL